jgi:putative addiction module component (TIGR02574 family)
MEVVSLIFLRSIISKENTLTLSCKIMKIMDIQSVKIDLIHWLTELQDTSVLKQLQGLKEQQESSHELSSEQKKEMDSRVEKYENGEMKFSSWDSVKNRIRNRPKDAL